MEGGAHHTAVIYKFFDGEVAEKNSPGRHSRCQEGSLTHLGLVLVNSGKGSCRRVFCSRCEECVLVDKVMKRFSLDCRSIKARLLLENNMF
jgi:hypothetical protein